MTKLRKLEGSIFLGTVSHRLLISGFMGLFALGLAGCEMMPKHIRQKLPAGKEYTNSIGIKMVRIEPGSFIMGRQQGGNWDERPVHKVNIKNPFLMGVTEVTNAQYEQFDPRHRHLRGRWGLSNDSNEAVIFVSWEDAMAFCRWLSKKEAKPYRLPTEAEWEYACRAGTTTRYYTGRQWPRQFWKNQQREWEPKPVSLQVGKTIPNTWGLFDMHGNVEEWCLDWYGPYETGEQTEPVGRAEGDSKVSRGGSHNTPVQYLRSANRMGTLPQDYHWLLGFRIVMGNLPDTAALPKPERPLWATDVNQQKCDWSASFNAGEPYFIGPKTYVKVPPNSDGPMFSKHNHDSALTWCDNGDLLAIWYSGNGERGRELCILASRLRCGAEQWEPASPFWDIPGRNDHAPALLNNGRGRLYHFNGLSVGNNYRKNLALIMRTSSDNGASWSRARIINAVRGIPNQPIPSTFCTRQGYLVVPCDWPWHKDGSGTALWISRDEGRSWQKSGGRIAGIHAGVVQLTDGRLMALGRHKDIDGCMPMSLSDDMGRSWTYKASAFQPVYGGQRIVLIRLKEGPLLCASFGKDMEIADAYGKKQKVSGLFAAISYDEGQTWPARRLISPGGPPRTVDGGGNTGKFTLSATSAEPKGYMAGVQTPNGIIHIISSKQYYAFNLGWVKTALSSAKEQYNGR